MHNAALRDFKTAWIINTSVILLPLFLRRPFAHRLTGITGTALMIHAAQGLYQTKYENIRALHSP